MSLLPLEIKTVLALVPLSPQKAVWVPSPQKGKPETLTHVKGAYIRKWEVWNRKPIKIYVINVVTTVELGFGPTQNSELLVPS